MMFLTPRLSATRQGGTLVLAGLIFVLGFAGGSGLLSLRSAPATESGSVRRASEGGYADPVRTVTGAGHPAEVLKVNDGDTFEARVLVWPGMQITTKVRLRGIDTPELKARCAEEYRRADAAREALRNLLAAGGVTVRHVGTDKYGGRVLADVATSNTADVSAALLRSGHGRPYDGGRRESWCDRGVRG
jgi:endonuclease YncB( thermonuclease family)